MMTDTTALKAALRASAKLRRDAARADEPHAAAAIARYALSFLAANAGPATE